MERSEQIAATVARAKREILEDVRLGRVPATVESFSRLHDYVDANGYGGAFEEGAPGWDEDPEEEGWVLDVDFWNAVQGQLDAWIKAGGLKVRA